MSYSALPIIGADSCPVRAYAIEGLPGIQRVNPVSKDHNKRESVDFQSMKSKDSLFK